MRIFFFFLCCLFCFKILNAQYYQIPYLNVGKNPGNLNLDNEYPPNGGIPPGWMTILVGAQASGNWSATFNIPFKFYFNGSLVTRYKASTSGLVTFNTKIPTRIDSSNIELPTSRIPDSTICIWGLRALARNYILTKTFGTAPYRQHWISYNAFSEQNLKNGWIYASVVLEETTNKIYIVDQRTQCILNNSACAEKTSLTLGLQVDSTYAVMVEGSPNYKSNNLNDVTPNDNTYFEFIPGIQPNEDISGLKHSFNKYYLKSEFPLSVIGSFKNTGASIITNVIYNFNVDDGTVYSQEISGLNVNPYANFEIIHPTLWNLNTQGSYSVKSWISHVNNLPSATSLDDTIRSIVVVNDSAFSRKLMHETFTSSTNIQCKSGNENLHAVLSIYPDLNTELNYPFNLTNNGDPYYTSECAARSVYYGNINPIPTTLIDGINNINPNNYNANSFVANQEIPAFIQILPSGSIKAQKIDINIDIKNLAPINSTTKLYVAIAEKRTVKNVKTNGEIEFRHVMKKLIPDANGTLIGELPTASNKTINFSWTVPGVYRLPLDARAANIINLDTENSIEDFSNLEIIAWLQDSNRNILQSNSADLFYIVGTENNFVKKQISLNPNPASDYFFINMSNFNANQTDLKVLISNTSGKLIYAEKTKLNSLFINSTNWIPGVYNIKVVGKNQEANQKIIIID